MSISRSIKDDNINSQVNLYSTEINKFNNYNFTTIPQMNFHDFELKKQKNNYMPRPVDMPPSGKIKSQNSNKDGNLLKYNSNKTTNISHNKNASKSPDTRKNIYFKK